MNVQCPQCRKTYSIPEERIKAYSTSVAFACPSCKGTIEIRAEKAGPQKDAAEATAVPTGNILKKRILRTVNDLPPMPQVADKARRVMADPDSSFADLAKVIETDQAIAARVLKLSNSSYYGVMGTVTSIQHASVVLGMKTLNELLTLACASSLLGSNLDGYELQTGDLWRHSLAVAGCARQLANDKHPELADDAFSAGLIHDCGKLILDKYILERKPQFDAFIQEEGKTFLDAERDILGFDHSQIAADVCEKWTIPKKLTTAIQYHHNPSMLGHNELAFLVHAADGIALMSGIGAGVDGMMYSIDRHTAEFLKLDSMQISTYMLAAAEYVEKTVGNM